MDPFYVFSPMYIYMPNTAGDRSLRFLMNAFGELIGLPVFFLPYTISLVLKGNPPAYSHFVLPPTSIHTHAHHVARKEVSSPMTSHVLRSHSNHHPQFQKPPFPAPFPTGLKKNLNLIVFSLLSHSLPRCSFHILFEGCRCDLTMCKIYFPKSFIWTIGPAMTSIPQHDYLLVQNRLFFMLISLVTT